MSLRLFLRSSSNHSPLKAALSNQIHHLTSRPVLLAPFPSPSPRLHRDFHTTRVSRDRSFTNLLADDNPPAVQVSSISEAGILLADGLLLPGACVFLEGKVFLWDVPQTNLRSKVKEERWRGWGEERFQLLEVVAPRPEILLLGTGATLVQPPLFLREYLSTLGIQLDVMDTRNACSTYNLLAEEGRRVAAALLPLTPYSWPRTKVTGANKLSP
ncbi:NADH dehydrogenase 1 alpha subcomplex assembly factor 3 [Flammula alnicola]|nr:NADH dehydrogenase 1 alpha subcomplex assembly factor 3 [Flammula alnicola]